MSKKQHLCVPDQDDCDLNLDEWTAGQLVRKYVNPTTLEARVVVRYVTGVEEDIESSAVHSPPQMITNPPNPSSHQMTDIASTFALALETKSILHRGHPSSGEQSCELETTSDSCSDVDPPRQTPANPDFDCVLSDIDDDELQSGLAMPLRCSAGPPSLVDINADNGGALCACP